MNEGTKVHLFPVDGHPDEDQLLLALERELPADHVAIIEQHLGNCWSCRARFEEMQQGILAFVDYRENRYLPGLPTPTSDSNGLRSRLRSVTGASLQESSEPLWRRLLDGLRWPRQFAWATATAAAMVIVILWTEILHPPVVSASELLTKAVAAETLPVPKSTGDRRRIVHQRVQIRSGQHTATREFQWSLDGPVQVLSWSRQPNPANWNAPLTAHGFAEWRDSLSDKADVVSDRGATLELRTSSKTHAIREATLVVRVQDYHAVQQSIRFADNTKIEMTELDFDVRERSIQDVPQRRESLSQELAFSHETGTPLSAEELNKSEIQARLALFARGLDLGEDFRIVHTGERVLVTGLASSSERLQAVRAELAGIPHVSLQLRSPDIGGNQAEAGRHGSSQQDPSVPASAPTPLLARELGERFTSAEQRRQFVDDCLSISDRAVSHAWALRRLAERYDRAAEAALDSTSASKLREMIQGHVKAIASANARLHSVLELLPSHTPERRPDTPDAWQLASAVLLEQVQRQDRALASLVTGANDRSATLFDASATFAAAYEGVNVLARTILNSLPGK